MEASIISTLYGHSNPVFTLELSQKPGILFSGGNDKGVVEWNLKNHAFIKVMFPVATTTYALHCPAGVPLLLAGLRNGDVLVYDFAQQKVAAVIKHHRKPVFDIQSVIAKNEILVASEDGTVSVWSMQDFNLLHVINVAGDTVRSIAISEQHQQVAFGCRDNLIRIYHLNDYTSLAQPKGHTMAVFTTQYTPDGRYLLTGGRDAQLRVWNAFTHELIHTIPAHLYAINNIACHPTLPLVATASMDKSIKIWGLNDFKLYKIISRDKGYPAHQLSVNKLVWNEDMLISTGDDKRIILWKITL